MRRHRHTAFLKPDHGHPSRKGKHPARKGEQEARAPIGDRTSIHLPVRSCLLTNLFPASTASIAS